MLNFFLAVSVCLHYTSRCVALSGTPQTMQVVCSSLLIRVFYQTLSIFFFVFTNLLTYTSFTQNSFYRGQQYSLHQQQQQPSSLKDQYSNVIHPSLYLTRSRSFACLVFQFKLFNIKTQFLLLLLEFLRTFCFQLMYFNFRGIHFFCTPTVPPERKLLTIIVLVINFVSSS